MTSLYSTQKVVLLLLFFFTGNCLLLAQDIRVQGQVFDDNGDPAIGASIMDEEKSKDPKNGGYAVGTITDVDGNFSLPIRKGGKLKITYIGFKDTIITVNSQQIEVYLESEAQELDEVFVVAKKVEGKMRAGKTVIGIKGNHFFLKTWVFVPKKDFDTDLRFVVQPFIYDVNDKERRFLTPIVFDSKRYSITQKRMYRFDEKQDPLSAYAKVKQSSYSRGDTVYYTDSIYIEGAKLRHDYYAEVRSKLVGYSSSIRVDSFRIADGTVNPLRFLQYKIDAFNIPERFIPKPMMQLMDTEGEVNLTFKLGKPDIDDDNPQNQVELNKMQKQLNDILTNPDASLQGLQIMGISSPDGLYNSNLSLAQLRTNKAMERILVNIKPEVKKSISMKSDAKVEEWKMAVELMEKDSLFDEARQIKEIIEENPDNMDKQFAKIKPLPFYNLLREKYLPHLRRVEYTYSYSIFRSLTDQEIVRLYEEKEKKLIMYEYYKLITTAKDETKKEEYCVDALKEYPKFIYAANELAQMRLAKGKPDSNILASFIPRKDGSLDGYAIRDEKKLPRELVFTQVASLLQEGNYSLADSIMYYMDDDNQECAMLKALTSTYNGDYEKGFDLISSISPMNAVLMLLATDQNNEAYNLSRKLGDTAKENYIKATTSNRLNRVSEAQRFLKKAFEQDPSLKETAKADGDILSLMPKEQQITNP